MLSTHTGMADALFSTTQQRVLGLLFGQPERSFYTAELIAMAGVGSGGVQRELQRLSQCGLISMRSVGNQKHYQANPQAPLFMELCSIVGKTVGLAKPMREALAELAPRIKAAFVFGSVAKRIDSANSDIDLMVIAQSDPNASLSYADLFSALEPVSQHLGRTVNPTIYTSQAVAKRLSEADSFLTRVWAQPKQWVIGGESDICI
jgi:predicted nucleotidyltransferase